MTSVEYVDEYLQQTAGHSGWKPEAREIVLQRGSAREHSQIVSMSDRYALVHFKLFKRYLSLCELQTRKDDKPKGGLPLRSWASEGKELGLVCRLGCQIGKIWPQN